MVSRKARVKQVVAPFVADAQVFAQQTFATESELFDQLQRGRIVRMNECLQAMQTEVLKAEPDHRRDRLSCEALLTMCGIDHVTDGHPLIADVAIVIIDETETEIGRFVGDRPKPIIRRRTVDKAPHRAPGAGPLRMKRRVPVTHRLGARETGVHRVHIVFAELAQPQPRRHQDWMGSRLLRYFLTAGSRLPTPSCLNSLSLTSDDPRRY